MFTSLSCILPSIIAVRIAQCPKNKNSTDLMLCSLYNHNGECLFNKTPSVLEVSMDPSKDVIKASVTTDTVIFPSGTLTVSALLSQVL